MSQSEPSAALRGAVDLSSLVNRAPAAEADATPTATPPAGAPPATGESQGSPYFFEGTDANFADFLDLSAKVPVVIDLWADWCGPCKQLSPILRELVAAQAGRLALVMVDVDANPQLAQAFRAQSIPTVAALVGGQPVSLFTGALPRDQVAAVFTQLLELAAQNGVTGSLDTAGATPTAEAAEAAEQPLPPHHAEALEAIERGDYAAAAAQYKTAIAQDPHDTMAVAGLAQVELMGRLDGRDPDAIRAAAASGDVDAVLAAADLDVSTAQPDAAFARLLDAFPSAGQDDRDRLRGRLVDYFEIVGADDPRVTAARARLASLLF